MVLRAQFPLIWYARKRYSLTFWPHPLGRGCVCGQNICYHVAASIVSFNLICNMTTFRKRYSLTFWHHPLGRGCVCGQNICYHVAASVVSFNLICNMTTFRKRYSLTFDPHPLGRGCVCGQKYLLPCCCQHRQLKFDMQHDHILKKLSFDLGPIP